MKIESIFEHQKFIKACEKYALIYGSEIKEKHILESLSIVFTGIPLATWQFIELCNKMELDPRSFITYNI